MSSIFLTFHAFLRIFHITFFAPQKPSLFIWLAMRVYFTIPFAVFVLQGRHIIWLFVYWNIL